jgi:hypothetical protein
MAKVKLHEHAALIDKFGPTFIANYLNSQKKPSEKPLTPQAVSMWRKRGISVWFRQNFAEFLILHGVAVPKDFVSSGHRGW